MNMTFDSGPLHYSLTGNCLSVFDCNGTKLWCKFFESVRKARKFFAEIAE